MPSACNPSAPAPSTVFACTVPSASHIRCQMVAWALVEICWPMMWCTTAENRSVSTVRCTGPMRSITSARRLSFCRRKSSSFSPYLPFALVQFGLHICQVSHPVATRRSVVESIGVRINVDAKELTANDTFEHLFQLRIIVG